VPEEELISKGYLILSRSPEVGADMFVRKDAALSIFLQGHLEYDPGALFREYRRDVRRFLAGERSSYPAMPTGYFDAEASAVLAAFQEQAVKRRSPEVFPRFPESLGNLEWAWREVAVNFYRNWLEYIAQFHNRRRLLETIA
jgi:homoserine O-succinyltransferase